MEKPGFPMVKEKPLLTCSLLYLVDYILHSYHTQKDSGNPGKIFSLVQKQ